MSIKDGGPAFARPETARSTPQTGMSLRDYFAGQALAAIAMSDSTWAAIAKCAYLAADAMLEARKS